MQLQFVSCTQEKMCIQLNRVCMHFTGRIAQKRCTIFAFWKKVEIILDLQHKLYQIYKIKYLMNTKHDIRYTWGPRLQLHLITNFFHYTSKLATMGCANLREIIFIEKIGQIDDSLAVINHVTFTWKLNLVASQEFSFNNFSKSSKSRVLLFIFTLNNYP